jgi:hypothetical protein
MSKHSFEQWEAHVQDTARTLHFPPTPDLAGAVNRRLRVPQKQRIAPRLLWKSAAVGLLVLAALFAVPPVRAAIVQILRVGAITIFTVEPTPFPTTAATSQPSVNAATSLSAPTATPLRSVLDLYGETTLEDARQRVDFPLRLPAHSEQIRPPDKVFVQDLGGSVVIMVWLDPDQPHQSRLSLHQFGPGTFAEKLQPRFVRETTVNGQRAVWARGPHLLQVWDKDRAEISQRRLVNGHVLIWQEGEVTYRIESTLQLDEAVQVAESLR